MIREWVLKWLMKPQPATDKGYDASPMPSISGLYASNKVQSSNVNLGNTNNGLNFCVYNAHGGKIIQLSSYDPRTDRVNNNLYIVTDQEDLGEEIGQIITRESLTR